MLPAKPGNGKESEGMDYHVHQQEEHQLPGAVSDIIGEGFTMSRTRPSVDQQVLEAMLRNATGQERIIAQNDLIIKALGNGGKSDRGKWWLSSLVAGGIAVTGMFGLQFVSRSQSTNEKELSNIGYRLEKAEEAAKEKNKEIRLLEEYNRDLVIWLSDRGIKGAPLPPKLKEDN